MQNIFTHCRIYARSSEEGAQVDGGSCRWGQLPWRVKAELSAPGDMLAAVGGVGWLGVRLQKKGARTFTQLDFTCLVLNAFCWLG